MTQIIWSENNCKFILITKLFKPILRISYLRCVFKILYELYLTISHIPFKQLPKANKVNDEDQNCHKK
jgi:hypothetical protein